MSERESGTCSRPFEQTDDDRKKSENRRQYEAPDAEPRIQESGSTATGSEDKNIGRHADKPRSRLVAFVNTPVNPVGQIDHDLRRRSRHQRRWRSGAEMHTMNRVLDRHGSHQHHPRQDRLPAIAVVEGTKANGEHGAAGQQENLKRKQAFEGANAANFEK